jgi:hypothetical protein
MKNFFIKIAALLGLISAVSIFLLPLSVSAQCSGNSTSNYCLLEAIPGAGNNGTTVDTDNFSNYASPILNVLYSIFGAIAVFQIVRGGFIRATSDAVSGQEEGRDLIVQAFIGLIIIFTSYALLNTLNPGLLNFSLVNVTSLRALINPSVTGGFQNPSATTNTSGNSSSPSTSANTSATPSTQTLNQQAQDETTAGGGD